MTERREKEGGGRTDGEIGRQDERHRVTEGGRQNGRNRGRKGDRMGRRMGGMKRGKEGRRYLGGDCSVSCNFLLCFSLNERLSRLARRP